MRKNMFNDDPMFPVLEPDRPISKTIWNVAIGDAKSHWEAEKLAYRGKQSKYATRNAWICLERGKRLELENAELRKKLQELEAWKNGLEKHDDFAVRDKDGSVRGELVTVWLERKKEGVTTE